MLEELFGSKTRVKILKQLIFNEKPYYLRELARIINISPIHVKKELEKLYNLGLILKYKKGKITFYKINKKSIIYNDLKNIFLKTEAFIVCI